MDNNELSLLRHKFCNAACTGDVAEVKSYMDSTFATDPERFAALSNAFLLAMRQEKKEIVNVLLDYVDQKKLSISPESLASSCGKTGKELLKSVRAERAK